MRKNSKPILVTGAHRSGTTWAGKMLAAAPHVAYVDEPFNLANKVTVNPKPHKYWYPCISNNDLELYGPILDDIVNFRYPLRANLARMRTLGNAANIVRGQISSLGSRIRSDRPLIKDPIALFSVETLCSKYDMDVLVMIRHPAAFCSSLKLKNWKFSFHNFLMQPSLMATYLNAFEAEITEYAKNEKDIIDQGILLWKCIYHTVDTYRSRHPEWLYVRHEELSSDPVNQFRSIYDTFGLTYTQKSHARILKSSGIHNPVEQQEGMEFIRNSKENISNWKKRLSKDEIASIRNGTAEVSCRFYSENEW